MKSHTVSSTNVSFNSQVFASDRPFEAVTSNQGLSIVRTRRSPLIGSGNQVSVNSHLRNRIYYWFGSTPNWNVTMINNTANFITFSQVSIIPQHVSGRNATVNISRTGIVSSSQTNDDFSPFGSATNLRMDSSGGINMYFDIVVPAVSPPPSNIFIQFNWGGFHSQSGTVLLGEALRTPTRTFSSWGNNRGVNVTVTLT